MNKEIEKMARLMCETTLFDDCEMCHTQAVNRGADGECLCEAYAEKIYNAGYRKQSDTENDIVQVLLDNGIQF